MTAQLHRHFPELGESLRRVTLGRAPTPVRPLEALSEEAGAEVWLKDDGTFGGPWGGNKVRKLEWTLADAIRRRHRSVLTIGALGTNHGLATALHARELGLRCVLALVDQPEDEHVREQLDRIRASGATVVVTRTRARTVLALPWLLARHASLRTGRLPYLLPVGGSSPLGCLGYVEAALELGEQVARGELPEPAHAVVPVGSAGTAAGLVLGLRLAGLRTRVVGVVVSDRTKTNPEDIVALAGRSAALLRDRGATLRGPAPDASRLDVHRDWMGPGYGHATEESAAALATAREREGLELEPVYTAKAMAGLIALGRAHAFEAGPVLYWHTHRSHPSGPPGA